MSEIGHNRLAELAGLIKAAHRDALQAAQRTAEQALEAGHHLVEAKASVGHGNWSGWLQENVGFSERTARRYMQLAKSGLKTATVAEIGIRGAAELLAQAKGVDRDFWGHLRPEQIPLAATMVREGRIIAAAEAREPGVLRRVVDVLVEAAATRGGDDMQEQLVTALKQTATGGRWTGPRELVEVAETDADRAGLADITAKMEKFAFDNEPA